MRGIAAFGMIFLLVGMAGCQSPSGAGESDSYQDLIPTPYLAPSGSDSATSLQEEDVDVIIYFPSWDYIGFQKPRVAEGAFLRYMNKNEAEQTLESLAVNPGTGVVIVDFYRSPEKLRKEQEEWASIFSKQGYKRIVFVKKEPNQPLKEARILKDQQL